MRKTTLLLCFLAWLCSLPGQAQDSLSLRLERLLSHPMFQTTQVGMMVYDLTDDTVLFCHHERQLLRPASTMKLLTAITALDRLGGSYELTTKLCWTGHIANGRLSGDLYCIGGMDPLITARDVEAMAEQLQAMGVDTIGGRIVVDQSMKEDQPYGEGWCWDDDNPRLLTLSVGRKDTFTDRLIGCLEQLGVVLTDPSVGTGRCPAGASLACQLTHPIDQVLERMLKVSDNFFAESLFYQIAAASAKGTAKASDARQAMQQVIRETGLNPADYRLADGSGLSLYNYLSAELETRLLRLAWQRDRIREHLLPALPVAGTDGTLQKRMTGAFTRGNVRAKTGTLTGISSLAGYCTAANGHQLCFAIINQGVLRGQAGKDFQDRVCQVLCQPWE